MQKKQRKCFFFASPPNLACDDHLSRSRGSDSGHAHGYVDGYVGGRLPRRMGCASPISFACSLPQSTYGHHRGTSFDSDFHAPERVAAGGYDSDSESAGKNCARPLICLIADRDLGTCFAKKNTADASWLVAAVTGGMSGTAGEVYG